MLKRHTSSQLKIPVTAAQLLVLYANPLNLVTKYLGVLQVVL